MALIKCPSCGNLVSNLSQRCPKCGFDIRTLKDNPQPVVCASPPTPTPTPPPAPTPAPTPAPPPAPQPAPAVPPTPAPAPAPQPAPQPASFRPAAAPSAPLAAVKKPGAPGGIIAICAAAAVLVIAGIIGVWMYFSNRGDSATVETDIDAPRLYPLVSTNIYESKSADPDKTIATAPYGAELIILEDDGEWSKVKYIPSSPDSKAAEGYIISRYAVSPERINLINGILSDNLTRSAISEYRLRRALLEYFEDKGYRGIDAPIAPAEKQEDTGSADNREQWAVTVTTEHKPNEVFFPRVKNPDSRFTDFAVIIHRLSDNQPRLLLFAFDDENGLPRLALEGDLNKWERKIESISRSPRGSVDVRTTE